MYCRNCGKQLSPQAEICMGCGVRPPNGDQFCNSCGAEVSPLAEMCVKCGAILGKAKVVQGNPKSKTAAVVLAVFLAHWTWLYTYHRNALKFWVGLVISCASTVLLFLGMIPRYHSAPIVWSIVLGAVIWLLAIIDTVFEPSEWYSKYPNG